MDSVDKSAFYIYVFSHNKMARLGKGYSTTMIAPPRPLHFKPTGSIDLPSRGQNSNFPLYLEQQSEENGSFQEKFIFDGIYQRKIPIEFQEIALTAHVLISLAGIEIDDFGALNLTKARNAAGRFLASRLEILDKSGSALDIALVARALQLAKSEGSEASFEILAKNRHEEISYFFWGHQDECDDALSIRATALALMVYIDRGEFYTEPIGMSILSARESI